MEPAFEVGFSVDGEFRPLHDGQECRVVPGGQGGYNYMVFPSLHAQGFSERPTVGCSLQAMQLNVSSKST